MRYLLLGVISVDSKFPRPWVSARERLEAGILIEDLSVSDSPNTILQKKQLKKSLDKRSTKSIHASAYIEYIAGIFADTIPTDGSKLALPYETLNQFYDEYVSFCKFTLNMKDGDFCAKETFRVTFIETPNIRLVGCKGKNN